MTVEYGKVWRRMALAALGVMILGLLAWSVSEGAIFLGGTKIDVGERPVQFWLEAVGIGAVGSGLLYLSAFGAHLVGLAPPKRR